jgi:hypothetical protein
LNEHQKTYEHREALHNHQREASLAERIESRKHVREFVRAEKAKRDATKAATEAKIPAYREAVAAAEQNWVEARAALAALIAEIDHAEHEYASRAGVLELRLAEYPDRQADAAIDAARSA